jgi:uncharacterized membrane protein
MSNLYLVALLLAFVTSIQVICYKYASKKLNQQTIIAATGATYFMFMLGYMLYNKDVIMTDYVNISSLFVIILITAGLLSVIQTLTYHHAISTYTPSVVHSLMSLTPVLVAVMSFLILGDNITQKQIIGIAIIVFGSIIIST